jgi:RNA polymerase sigma-70 factor (ECF subfamily)
MLAMDGHSERRGMAPTDDELLCRYRDHGDAQAFEVLFHRHSSAVHNFARGMLSDTSAAEEILQETFLAVTRNVQNYTPQGYFKTWLLRIARNLCLNAIEARSIRRSIVSPLDDPGDCQASAPRTISPPVCAQSAEELLVIQNAIAQLPPQQREAILLYAFDDMHYRHIAQVLDIPTNTVKTLIHRARATLAKALAPTLNDGDTHD